MCSLRIGFFCLLFFACTTPSQGRVKARLYDASYYPPYTTTSFVMVDNVPIVQTMYYPAEYILWFDIGEKDGMPAYVSRSDYESALIGASYDITYSNGEGCENIRRVTQFN